MIPTGKRPIKKNRIASAMSKIAPLDNIVQNIHLGNLTNKIENIIAKTIVKTIIPNTIGIPGFKFYTSKVYAGVTFDGFVEVLLAYIVSNCFTFT